jgi:hypothetical protein
MSPASYLTAPPRVAGASIASIATMSALIWGSLALFLVVLVVGLVVVGILAFALWRRARVTLDTGSQAMDDLAASMEGLEARLSRAEGQTTELERVAARLSRSLAGARILLASAQESRDSISGWLRFIPRT